jgi:3'(2'), 5'-bisphosphate nucleotidase
MINLENPEIQFAVETVRRAALLARQIRQEIEVEALAKEDYSPVTIGDFACQALVGSLIEEKFPADALVAEEESTALSTPEQAAVLDMVTEFTRREIPGADADKVKAWIDRGTMSPGNRFWTLDPIDGTKGFLRGDQYATAFALIIDGELQIGALGCPNLGDPRGATAGTQGTLLVAARGQGTWATSLAQPGKYEKLVVSDRSATPETRMLRSFEAGHTNTGQIGEVIDRLAIVAEPVRMDSQAKYCVLAAGGGDLLVRLLSARRPDYREKIWDQAAGAIVVEEAGGRITDLHGHRLDFSAGRTLANNRGVLASNGLLHPAALDALDAIGA